MRKIKRFALVLLMALATCFSMFALSSCDMLIEKGDREEKHTVCVPGAVPDSEKLPTCTEDGYKVFNCVVCGKECKTETVKALGHEYDDVGVVTTEPTCTEKGVKTYTCTRTDCNASKTEDIPAKGHTEQTVDGKAATCTETGLTDGKQCSDCKAWIVEQESIDALGHSYDSGKVTKEPTCTEKGVKTYTCTRTDCNASKTEDIPAKGHTEQTVDGKAATCTETGLTDGTQCSVCEAWIVKQETIPAPGHNEAIDPAVAATCTATGLTEGKHCSTCNEVLVAQTVVEKIKHNMVIDLAVEPTCTETGLTKGWHCAYNCGEMTVEREVVPATGHDVACANAASKKATCRTKAFCGVCGVEYGDLLEHELAEGQLLENCYQVVQGMPASCTEPGFKDYVVCTYEGCGYTTFEEIPALGHTWGVANVEDNGYLPTCTEEGREKRETCTVCGATQGWAVVPATGHTEVTLAAEEATCIKTGLTEGKRCTVCNEITVAQEVVPMIPHDMKEQVITAVTCTENGLLRYTCSVCHLSKDQVVYAQGHVAKTLPEVKATCEQDGLTEGKECIECGEVLVAQQTVTKLGHNYVETVELPTCTVEGVKTFTCKNGCGDTYTEEIAALGHDVDCTRNTASRKANCMQGAFCGDCGVEYTERNKDHEPALVAVLAKAPTCTEVGWNNYWYCAEASCGYTSYKEIPATGHNVVVYNYADATCTEKGHEAFEGCTNCGMCDTTIDGVFNPDKTFEEISWAALGHDVVVDPKVEAQCGQDGLTEGSHCGRCNVVLVAQETISASSVAHTFNVTALEDCEVGIYCLNCSYVEVAPTTHTEEALDEVLPTCTSTGLTEGKKCSVCQKILVAQQTVDMLDHDYATEGVVTTEPTCTTTGVMTYTCKDCPAFYTESIDELGHNPVAMDEVAKTCTTSGWKGGEKCERCGIVLVAQEEVPASHEYEKVPEKMPTCTETGHSAHQKCKDCGHTTEYIEYPMHAHDYVGDTCQICLKKKDSAEE